MIEASLIQPLEFYNMDYETRSPYKSQTWKNNNVKIITNQNN
jgi:hypothetical protein